MADMGLEIVRHDLLYEPRQYSEVKDPSPVFDGTTWHVFGTGISGRGLEILHLTAPAINGPWREEPPAALYGVDHIRDKAAPGVVVEGATLHMFLQEHFNQLGGRIHHLVSDDGGKTFEQVGIALKSRSLSGEAGIYDPDGAGIDEDRYLTYAAMMVVGQPDLYLARSRSGSWDGPWERLGCILDHAAVPQHNQRGSADYEWGLEGPQLVELPGGSVLLTAVCFLAGRPRGHRQRLFLAVADSPEGPYAVLGPAVDPRGQGENGHGTAVIEGGLVHLVYQQRAGEGQPWRFMRATVTRETLLEAAAAARQA